MRQAEVQEVVHVKACDPECKQGVDEDPNHRMFALLVDETVLLVGEDVNDLVCSVGVPCLDVVNHLNIVPRKLVSLFSFGPLSARLNERVDDAHFLVQGLGSYCQAQHSREEEQSETGQDHAVEVSHFLVHCFDRLWFDAGLVQACRAILDLACFDLLDEPQGGSRNLHHLEAL